MKFNHFGVVPTAPAANILLVEDDDTVRDVITRALTREGYGVTEAGSISEAMDFIRHGEFLGYVVDYRLTDGDCLEILSFLKERGDQKPTLVVTGLATQDTVGSMVAYGVRDVLVKPFRIGQLREVVHKHFPLEERGLAFKTIEAPEPQPSRREAAEGVNGAHGSNGTKKASSSRRRRLPLALRIILALLLQAAALAATLFLFS